MTAPARVVARVDALGESWSTGLRGRPWADTTAATLSAVSDYGYVWIALALVKARRRGRARTRAVLGLAGAGIASYGVNRAIKAVVARGRPRADAPTGAVPTGAVPTGPVHRLVRPPSGSSFPSGHTLAAFCTAVSLSESAPERAAALAFASAVAASRVHLRAHHLSDVAGGAVVGVVVGVAVRAALPRPARSATRVRAE